LEIKTPKQGDIYFVSLDSTISTEISKTRPGVVVSNDYANKRSKRVLIVPVTSSNIENVFPFEVLLNATSTTWLKFDSKVACDQVRSIDKSKLIKNIGKVSVVTLEEIKASVGLHFGL